MIAYYKKLDKQDRVYFWLSMAIILAGIVLRLVVWVQNRDLIIDEANIARNLFEKSFGQLAGRLSYEQYAPVVFIWIEKLFSIVFGFSEQALRAYPLLTGLTALFVYMLVLKEFVSLRSLWYPLLCFATAHFFIRYSTEIKQYMPDVLIVLTLILLALKNDILTAKTRRFFFTWLIAGSIAIWSSMPSVFALAGVGCYYLYICIKGKKMQKLVPFVIASIIIIAQFAVYYFSVLEQDAHSAYLQNYHADYFLVATPTNYHEWAHNWYRTSELVKLATGFGTFSKILNFGLLFYGTYIIIRRHTAKGLLVVIPLAATIFAASVNEFSLIPRVCLFTMPLFLILIAVGISELFSAIKPLLLKAVLVGMLLYSAYLNNDVKVVWKPFYSEQLTWAMQLMKDNGIKKDKLYVSHGSYPAFLYYTTIHPDKQRWYTLEGAGKKEWNANWGEISAGSEGKFGVVFSTIGLEQAREYRSNLKLYSKEIAFLEVGEAKSYGYVLTK